MFREIKNAYQKDGEPKMRWFSSSEMDLFVWSDDEHKILSYHLTYNKSLNERALVWSIKRGFSHSRVDDGANPGRHPMSPVFVGDEEIQAKSIISMLLENQGELDAKIKAFIISGINKQYLSAIESE